MLRIVIPIACATLLALPLQANEKSVTKNQTALDGMWAVTEASVDGMKVELPHTWTFKTNGKANLIDRKKGTQSLFRYTLDHSAAPRRIELVYLGPDARMKDYRQIGVWKLDGDSLTILLSQPTTHPATNEDNYPAAFEKPGEREMLLVLEKQKLE